MNVNKPNIQDQFLNAVKRDGVPVSVFVTNGFKITGAKVIGFDNYAVLIETNGQQMLVYKHAVSSIVPETAVKTEEQ